ncbi:hypothetical protein L211DRAFT_848876 [Terfezia boudieri ATCC MYA-4762]|uniref:Uncharacterized protein n=1 Tax=Terfezia boudieri ATCC MYA-4762 TaxID=1051890 RepID=A0A3N4LSQ2_9PEZI|nr:hypothetical protein L211DRAFT_848876 [Terfezia boudieri ATCC MYA-4762]
MLRRSRRQATLPHGVAREQQTEVSTCNAAGGLEQPVGTLQWHTISPMPPLRDRNAHPTHQGEGGERGIGQLLGKSQMESESRPEKQRTDDEPGPKNRNANELHPPAHDAPETAYYTVTVTNLINAGLQSQINLPQPVPARYMPTDSSNARTIVPVGPRRGWSRPPFYTKQSVNEQVGSGVQKAGTGARVGETPGNIAGEEQVRDDSSSGAFPQHPLFSTGKLEDGLAIPRPCIPFNGLPLNVRSALTIPSSLEVSSAAIPTASSLLASAAPGAVSKTRSEYGGIDVGKHQHNLASNWRAFLEPVNVGEIGQAGRMDSSISITSGQMAIPCTFSGVVKGRGRGSRSLRGGISRKPSLEDCRQISPATKAELMNTLLSGEGSSTLASADYFSRPPSRLPVAQSTATTPGVSDVGTTPAAHASSCSSSRESFHQNQPQLPVGPNPPVLSTLVPENIQASIGTNSRAIIQVLVHAHNSSLRASAHPEGQGRGKAKKDKGKGVEYLVRASESTSESYSSASQGSAIVPTGGIRQNQTQTEALAHAHLAIVDRGSHGFSSVDPLTGMRMPINQSSGNQTTVMSNYSYSNSQPAAYADLWHVQQVPHIESIDGSTGARSYQTLPVGEIYNILYESQRSHPHPRPLEIRPSNLPVLNQFDANGPPPVETPSSAWQRTPGGRGLHLPLLHGRLPTRGFSIPMQQYSENLATADSSTSIDNYATSLALNGSWDPHLNSDPQGLQLSTIPPEQDNNYHLWPNVDFEQMYDEQLARSGNPEISAINPDLEILRQPRAAQLAQSGWAFPANTQTSTALPVYNTVQDYYSMSGSNLNADQGHQRQSPLAHLARPPEGTLWGYSRTTNYVLLDSSIQEDPSFVHWRRLGTQCHACVRLRPPEHVNPNAGDSGASNQNMDLSSTSLNVWFPGPTGVSPGDFLDNASEFQWNPAWQVNAPVATTSTIAGFPWNPTASATGPHATSRPGSTGVTASINDKAIATENLRGFRVIWPRR